MTFFEKWAGQIDDETTDTVESGATKRPRSDEVYFDNAADRVSQWRNAIDPAFRRPV
jgi:hypothetical protein